MGRQKRRTPGRTGGDVEPLEADATKIRMIDRVLVVDDTKPERETVEYAVQRFGAEVVSAKGPAEAKRKLEGAKGFDMVFLDYHLRGFGREARGDTALTVLDTIVQLGLDMPVVVHSKLPQGLQQVQEEFGDRVTVMYKEISHEPYLRALEEAEQQLQDKKVGGLPSPKPRRHR